MRSVREFRFKAVDLEVQIHAAIDLPFLCSPRTQTGDLALEAGMDV